jgi:GNAT superfamily N-acetyltransferase
MTARHGDITLTDDRSQMDWERVHGWLSSSYWTPDIPLARLQRGAAASALVVGAFAVDGQQVAFARVISDTTRFAFLCDVWVEEASRGKGLGRALVKFAIEHPLLSEVDLWCLRTVDAHGVYQTLEFTELSEPWKWMEFRRPR